MIHIHEMINSLNGSVDAINSHVDFLASKADMSNLSVIAEHHSHLSDLAVQATGSNSTGTAAAGAATSSTSVNLFTPGFGAGVGAGCAMLGATGVGIGQGYTAGEAVEGLARNPKMESKIRMTMLIGAAIAESSAIYALIISILLIFVAPNLIK